MNRLNSKDLDIFIKDLSEQQLASRSRLMWCSGAVAKSLFKGMDDLEDDITYCIEYECEIPKKKTKHKTIIKKCNKLSNMPGKHLKTMRQKVQTNYNNPSLWRKR